MSLPLQAVQRDRKHESDILMLVLASSRILSPCMMEGLLKVTDYIIGSKILYREVLMR